VGIARGGSSPSIRIGRVLQVERGSFRLPDAMADTAVIHPNRDKAESKATRAAVMLLLIASSILVLIITVGGWVELQGAQIVSAMYIILYAVMAFLVSRWNRGVLPVAAGMAILLAVVAAVAAPGWFERAKDGFRNPALDPNLLGLLTIIVVPVQLLLILVSLRGMQQKWNVEVEVAREDADRFDRGDYDQDEFQPAET
jgi:lysylphosphatidylglycerol synthetase-like protein (DUF2156 family)